MTDAANQKQRMPRGAIPSPRSALAAASPYIPDPNLAVPSSYLMWPSRISYWGNDEHKDCVSAEEAFAKVAAPPHIFISDATLTGWASRNGYLDKAYISAVLTTMTTEGIAINLGTLRDGSYRSVDWTDAAKLKSAIYSLGPVKLGVRSADFENNAQGWVTPGSSGWAMFGYPQDTADDEYHCVSLCGYGASLSELVSLFQKNGVSVNVPEGMPEGRCYAMFSWNSIGIIDEASLLNMTDEAWVRNPVTIPSGFPTVSKFQLYNDGGFVVDIHARYRQPAEVYCTEAPNYDNFPVAQTRTMDLATKCTSPTIQAGDIVQMKAWVEAGKDNTYNGVFLYDPKGPTQAFKISGSTQNNSLEYLGPQ